MVYQSAGVKLIYCCRLAQMSNPRFSPPHRWALLFLQIGMAGSAAVRERMQWTSVIEKGLLERMADWVAARWMEQEHSAEMQRQLLMYSQGRGNMNNVEDSPRTYRRVVRKGLKHIMLVNISS